MVFEKIIGVFFIAKTIKFSLAMVTMEKEFRPALFYKSFFVENVVF